MAGQLNDDVRFDLWEPAVKLWQEDVWFGIGPAHYNYRFRPYRPQWVQRQPDRVHNDYLNTLTDYGIVGAVLVLSAWVLLFTGVVKTWRFVRGSSGDLGGRNSNKFALVLGASAGLLAILVHSAADFNMHIPANALVAITLMAMLSGSLRFATEQHWHNARFWSKAVMTVILLAGLAYLGRQEIRHEKESRWLAEAASSSATRADQLAALEHAFAIEPTNFETAYAIGENLRSQAWDAADPEKLGKAMEWYKRTTSIDPYYGYGFLGCGLCLDRLDKESESWPDFDRAIKLDPNGYYTAAWVGWHYVQAGDYAAARDWFERSYRLSSDGNKIAHDYLEIVRKRMLEAASRPGPG